MTTPTDLGRQYLAEAQLRSLHRYFDEVHIFRGYSGLWCCEAIRALSRDSRVLSAIGKGETVAEAIRQVWWNEIGCR